MEDQQSKITGIRELFRSSSDRLYPGEVAEVASGGANYSIEGPLETSEGLYLYAGNPRGFFVGEAVVLSCDVLSDDETLIPYGTEVEIVEITPLPAVYLAVVKVNGDQSSDRFAQVKLPVLVRGKVA